MKILVINRRLRSEVRALRRTIKDNPDLDRTAKLVKHEQSLWKANAKLWRVYQDFDRLRDCMCYMMQHGLFGTDQALLEHLPKEFGGKAEYRDSDIKDWDPWWRKIKNAPGAPIPDRFLRRGRKNDQNTSDADRILARYG